MYQIDPNIFRHFLRTDCLRCDSLSPHFLCYCITMPLCLSWVVCQERR
jgi:hypothetical protein